jgi:hypothetical protein
MLSNNHFNELESDALRQHDEQIDTNSQLEYPDQEFSQS